MALCQVSSTYFSGSICHMSLPCSLPVRTKHFLLPSGFSLTSSTEEPWWEIWEKKENEVRLFLPLFPSLQGHIGSAVSHCSSQSIFFYLSLPFWVRGVPWSRCSYFSAATSGYCNISCGSPYPNLHKVLKKTSLNYPSLNVPSVLGLWPASIKILLQMYFVLKISLINVVGKTRMPVTTVYVPHCKGSLSQCKSQ